METIIINDLAYDYYDVKPGEVGTNYDNHIFFGLDWKRIRPKLQDSQPVRIKLNKRFYLWVEYYDKYPGYVPAHFDIHIRGVWHRFKEVSEQEYNDHVKTFKISHSHE